MSVIQKIRTKYAKLAGGVIALALVAFILMDALSSRTGSLFGRDSSVAKVNGDKIEYVDFSRRVQEYEVLYGSQQQLDDKMRAQLNEQALRDLVKEKLLSGECEDLGLVTTEAEKKDMIYGINPDPAVRNYQAFVNPETKQFDPQYVKLFEEQVDQLDPSGKARAHWENLKEYILRTALEKKYNALFSGAAYIPTFLVKAQLENQDDMASINYVSIPYETVKDEIKVSDDEVRKYMKEHKDEFYSNQETRTIEYVSFNVTPTKEDTMRALGVLNEVKDDFAAATDNESFVNRNSDESYAGTYQMKKDMMSAYADSINDLSVGQVYGPYFENDAFKLTKVTDRKTFPDSVKCRHILVKFGQELADSLAKNRIDSIAGAIKAGANFNDMVQKYSDDQGSKQTGGEYTFTFQQKQNLSKEFADFVFEGKTGENKIVKVENRSYTGYHYIEILEQKNFMPAIKTATVSKALYAGDNTENEVYARATEFAANATSAEAFDERIKNDGLQKMLSGDLSTTDFSISGIGPAREIIRWTFKAEKGEVSPIFSVTGRYVVAKLTGVSPKGLKPITDDVREGVKARLTAKTKMQTIAKKYNDKKTLQEISQASGQDLGTADSFRNRNSFIGGSIGYEPRVAGYSFYQGLKQNELSPAIQGQNGVFYIVLKNRMQGTTKLDSAAITERKTMETGQIKDMIGSSALESLRKDADIKYNPDNF